MLIGISLSPSFCINKFYYNDSQAFSCKPENYLFPIFINGLIYEKNADFCPRIYPQNLKNS
ncbi:hypothetical protein CIN01S_10_01520 [Chryseobacterium indologenes NBRC 14944]|nr:hypothetical protein CIN01S_10_01520 [Chryseobacterium indologenes NBRC 14944]